VGEQVWKPTEYSRHAAFVPELGRPLLELLSPRPGERVLDLGCGPGDLALAIAGAGASVVGVDRSPEMVAAARVRGLEAVVADAYDLPFQDEFDAVFSNAALHWMKADPDAVLRGVRRALHRTGRFVGELGGAGNVARIRAALWSTLSDFGLDPKEVDPWYFPSAEEYRARLEFAGLVVERIELFARPTPLPTGIEGWLDTFGGPFFQAFPADARAAARAKVVEQLRPTLADPSGHWTADYVRLRFRAWAVR
jgi:SAM-dependent methyltransferase